MSVSIGKASFNIAVNTDELKKSTDKANGVIQSASKKMNQSFASNLAPLAGKIKDIFINISNRIYNAIKAVANKTIGIIKDGVKQAAKMETIQATFTSSLGKQGAADFTKWINDFAAQTPFEIEGLLSATQKLMAFGLTADQTKGAIERIGDAAAHSGNFEAVGAIAEQLGRIYAQGRITSENMNVLITNGVPAWELLAKALGTDVAGAMDRVRKGTVDGTTAVMGLLGQFEQYQGAMNEVAQTAEGRMGTLEDTWAGFLNNVGQIFMPTFKEILEYFTAGLEIFSEYVERYGPQIQKFVQNLFSKIINIVAQVGNVGANAFSYISEWKSTLGVIVNIFVVLHNSAVGFMGVIAKISLTIAEIIDGMKAVSENGFDKEKWKNWKSNWDDTQKQLTEDVNNKMLAFMDTGKGNIGDIFAGRNAQVFSQDFINNIGGFFGQIQARVQENRDALSKPLPYDALKLPASTKKAVVDDYKKFYEEIQKVTKQHYDALGKMGTDAWASQIFGNIPDFEGYAQQIANGQNNSMEAKQDTTNILLEQIAEKMGIVTDGYSTARVQNIPLEGY